MKMKKVFIVTGTSRGLGKSLVDLALEDTDTFVISLSRSQHEGHKSISGSRMLHLNVDFGELFESAALKVIDTYIYPDTCIYFINNAGLIQPIKTIGQLKGEEIAFSIKVNIEYPINLINTLVRSYNNNRLILVNVTSGAAKGAIANWSLYSAAKAYMQVFFKVLAEENIGNKKLQLHSIDPGTMDTDMQSEIRQSKFPKHTFFESLKATDRLIDPEEVAKNILKIIEFGI